MAKFLLLGLLWLLSAAPVLGQGTPRRLPARARPRRVARLPPAVLETSGLQFTDGKLWTLNDGGNAPVLFRLDTATGAVLQQVYLRNQVNIDWEDLAADARYLYVGDFGNNAGDRRNLRVLRVAKAALGSAPLDTVTAEEIAFRYPEQTDFTARMYRHDFDCEAFFYANDSLHLFTKNWTDQRTRYYTLPARPGTHVAHLKGSFDADCLITAAAISPAGTTAALLGYRKTGGTFLWLLTDFQGTGFLAGTRRHLRLSHALRLGQAEGLCFVDDSRVLLSNERLPKRFALVPQRLYALSLRRWLGASRPANSRD